MQERTTTGLKKIPCQHGYYHAHVAPRDAIAKPGLSQTDYASYATHITTPHQNALQQKSPYNLWNLHTVMIDSPHTPWMEIHKIPTIHQQHYHKGLKCSSIHDTNRRRKSHYTYPINEEPGNYTPTPYHKNKNHIPTN